MRCDMGFAEPTGYLHSRHGSRWYAEVQKSPGWNPRFPDPWNRSWICWWWGIGIYWNLKKYETIMHHLHMHVRSSVSSVDQNHSSFDEMREIVGSGSEQTCLACIKLSIPSWWCEQKNLQIDQIDQQQVLGCTKGNIHETSLKFTSVLPKKLPCRISRF